MFVFLAPNHAKKKGEEVAPDPRLYDFIVFKGENIKNVAVFDENTKNPPKTPDDPAIVHSQLLAPSASLPTTQIQRSVPWAPGSEQRETNTPSGAIDLFQPDLRSRESPSYAKRVYPRLREPHELSHPSYYSRTRGYPGPRGGEYMMRSHRRGPHFTGRTGREFAVARDPEAARSKFTKDFELESANFEKESPTPMEKQRSYEKSNSFFDSISSELISKSQIGNRRSTAIIRKERHQAQQTDLETFGSDFIRDYRKHYSSSRRPSQRVRV